MKNLIPLAALLLLSAACSIKENRADCPCYLHVSFEERGAIGHDGVRLIAWNSDELFHENDIDITEHNPYWVRAVRKDRFTLSASRGVEGAIIAAHAVTVPEGSAFPPAWSSYHWIDATGENAYSDFLLHKQYAEVRLQCREGGPQMEDLAFTVRGSSCGFDLLTLEAVEGAFRYVPANDGTEVRFRLPRQADDALSLEIRRSGEHVGDFALGRYLHRAGYNWKALDLKDIDIVLDLVIGQVYLIVDGWEEGTVITLTEL